MQSVIYDAKVTLFTGIGVGYIALYGNCYINVIYGKDCIGCQILVLKRASVDRWLGRGVAWSDAPI